MTAEYTLSCFWYHVPLDHMATRRQVVFSSHLACIHPVHVHTLVHLGTVLLGLLSVMQHR
jgi:hypothetical protein